jgi:hypothetical protein
MRLTRSVLIIMTASALSAATAMAQGSKPQVAGIAPAPQASSGDAPVFPRRGHHTPYYRGAVPVLVTNDGQIYADFGYGYEPVIRSCGYSGGMAYAKGPHGAGYSTPSYTPPTYTPPAYTPPSYTPPAYGQTTFGPRNTQPAPAQATQSERDLAAATTAGVAPAPQARSQRVGSAACWRTDEQGRVIVVRP